jgi:hypothetical protein
VLLVMRMPLAVGTVMFHFKLHVAVMPCLGHGTFLRKAGWTTTLKLTLTQAARRHAGVSKPRPPPQAGTHYGATLTR